MQVIRSQGVSRRCYTSSHCPSCSVRTLGWLGNPTLRIAYNLLGLPRNKAPGVRSSARTPDQTSSSGGGGGLGGSGKGFGGSNGEPDDHSDQTPQRFTWSGWEARVAADPQFVYKVLVEQIIGVGAAVIGDMSSRPYWGLFELDFVFSTLVVGSLMNFSLMYLLAPSAGSAGTQASSNMLGRLFGDSYLRAWSAPSGHMFEAGYPLSRRLVNLGYKGAVFALVGMAAGLVGTAVSNCLIAVRKAVDPAFEPQNALPNVPLNAACWASHMGVSSNLRYQLINGLEMALQPTLPPLPFRLLTSAVRTGNNVVGGMSFVLLAKIMGVQQSQGDEVKEQEKLERSL